MCVRLAILGQLGPNWIVLPTDLIVTLSPLCRTQSENSRRSILAPSILELALTDPQKLLVPESKLNLKQVLVTPPRVYGFNLPGTSLYPKTVVLQLPPRKHILFRVKWTPAKLGILPRRLVIHSLFKISTGRIPLPDLTKALQKAPSTSRPLKATPTFCSVTPKSVFKGIGPQKSPTE